VCEANLAQKLQLQELSHAISVARYLQKESTTQGNTRRWLLHWSNTCAQRVAVRTCVTGLASSAEPMVAALHAACIAGYVAEAEDKLAPATAHNTPCRHVSSHNSHTAVSSPDPIWTNNSR
jgi:hypothetical protein